MRKLSYYLNNNHNFDHRLGTIKFELDDLSMQYLSEDFRQRFTGNTYIITEDMLCEMSKNADRYNLQDSYKGGNRTIWSKDGDELKIGTHATEREDRPVDKGGDGEHIDEQEIIDIFRYTWLDIMDMYNEGLLESFEYKGSYVQSFTTLCKCYLIQKDDNLIPDGARPANKHLWCAWMPQEGEHYKLDIIIRTIFRGEYFKHTRQQERILIANNGFIKQIKPKN